MNEVNRPLKVFLSYAVQDRPLVRELSRQLVGEGWIDTWVDEKSLLPGQDWRVKIEEAVEEADVVIICLSNHSVSKEGYVQKELRYAREIALEKPEETIFLIPLRLDECEVPRGLRFYQWVDYFGDEKNTNYDALVKSLKLRYEQKLKLEELERIHEEKARLETEELSRQKAEKEKLEREAAQKAAREKLEKDASEKARLEAEELARQKSEKEKKEREVDKKNTHAKIGKESPEKIGMKAEEHVEPENLIQRIKNKSGNQTVILGIAFIVVAVLFGMLSANGKKMFVFSVPTSTGTYQMPTPLPTASITKPSLAAVVTNIPTSTAIEAITPTVTKAATATNYAGSLSVEIRDAKNILMRLVPAGVFIMGKDGYYDAQPAHTVYLDDFYMDAYEVTNIHYKECVDSGVCEPPQLNSSYNYRPSYYGNSQYSNYPVVNVKWGQAITYCKWRDSSLPTEAQWEKAARGTDGRTYPTGETILCDQANYFKCNDETDEVGSRENGKSPYGIYDLAGNVSEWVADWYSNTYYQNSPLSNPSGPDTGQYRVVRGGAWHSSKSGLTTFIRDTQYPDNIMGVFWIGFRCAKDAKP